MKIYISLDMEGIAGTINWEQEKTDLKAVRKYMADQIEWVIEGIKKSSRNNEIDEIVIADSHNVGNNLFYEITALDPRVHLISGSIRPQYMMPAFSDYYDVVFFVGYHGGIGEIHANMDHTYSLKVHKFYINGIPMSETLINAAYAGYYNVPVGLIIGDKALKQNLMQEDMMPWVKYVTTKYAISRYAVKQRPQEIVRNETIEAVKAVLDKDIKKIPVYKFDSPVTMKIEFNATGHADAASLIPGIKRLDGYTVEFKHDDYKILFDAIMAITLLATFGS